MSNTIFELKDGRIITIDFTNIDDLIKVEKSDLIEINQQLKEWLNISRDSIYKDINKKKKFGGLIQIKNKHGKI